MRSLSNNYKKKNRWQLDSNKTRCYMGIPWWSSGQGYALPLQGARVPSVGWGTKILQAVWCGQEKKKDVTFIICDTWLWGNFSHSNYGNKHKNQKWADPVVQASVQLAASAFSVAPDGKGRQGLHCACLQNCFRDWLMFSN